MSAQISTYAKYTKPRLEIDPEFRKKHRQYMSKYVTEYYLKNEEYRKKVDASSKASHRRRYELDPSYRELKRQQALDRYYEKKILNWYVNLFEQDA